MRYCAIEIATIIIIIIIIIIRSSKSVDSSFLPKQDFSFNKREQNGNGRVMARGLEETALCKVLSAGLLSETLSLSRSLVLKSNQFPLL